MQPFVIQRATHPVPIIVSVPHCGTAFPEELLPEFVPGLIRSPDDTDWFVDKLYGFAPSMGITLIHANYSRWVIDLNRNPDNKPLYSDGRIITGLCPVTNFLGESLYRDNRDHVDDAEVARRLSLYYKPYHQTLETLIQETKQKFGKVLLWDCHSIRHRVKTIQEDRFPDLNLGDNDGESASVSLTKLACEALSASSYSFSHNDPFKGGFITRYYGRPGLRENALQLEMNKLNYMDDAEVVYHPERAAKMQDLLKYTFSRLIVSLLQHE